MTLEEAKKRIAQHVCKCRRDYNTYGDEHVKGEEYGLRHALSILKQVDTEPAPKDSMTLTELAHELRKIFRFKYLAYGEEFRWGQVHYQLLISDEPFHLEVIDEGGEGCPCIIHEWFGDGLGYLFDATEYLVPNLDLSEYANENGTIDYSKCIVEV